MRWLLLLVMLVGAARAQNGVSLVEVTEALKSATSVVWIGSYLRVRPLAEALRQVRVSGIPVMLVTSGYTYLDGSSYFVSLYLARCSLLLGVPDEYMLDTGSRLFYGPGLGRGGDIYEAVGEERSRKLARLQRILQAAQIMPYSPERILRYWMAR